MPPYTLSLYTPVLDPPLRRPAFVCDLSPAAHWRRSVRAVGGDWAGQLVLGGEEADLLAAFDSWLGYHLVERVAGVVTWTGYVHELEWAGPGPFGRRRSLSALTNAVRARYTQPGVAPALTPWHTAGASIGRYGRQEQTVIVAAPLASAELIAAKSLAAGAWPVPRPGVGRPVGLAQSATLIVRCRGYLQSANRLYATVADAAAPHDVSDWIAALIGAEFGLSPAHGGASAAAGDCELLKTGAIAPNPLPVWETPDTDLRVYDLLRRLVALGDAAGRPWTLAADAERRVHYAPLDGTPRYFLRGGSPAYGERGALSDTLGGAHPVPPWLVRPAVVRDLNLARRGVEPGSFLSDTRDAYVDRVEVIDGRLALTASEGGETAVLAEPLE